MIIPGMFVCERFIAYEKLKEVCLISDISASVDGQVYESPNFNVEFFKTQWVDCPFRLKWSIML